MVKAKQKTRGTVKVARSCIVRLMVTPDEQYELKKLAWDQTGGNVSEYVRRKLFPQNGANNGQREDSTE